MYSWAVVLQLLRIFVELLVSQQLSSDSEQQARTAVAQAPWPFSDKSTSLAKVPFRVGYRLR